MRLVGWLASLAGLVGVVVCNGIASVIWVVKFNLRARARDLLALPDGGLEMARTLTDAVATSIAELSDQIGGIKATADQLVAAPVVDAAAAAGARDRHRPVRQRPLRHASCRLCPSPRACHRRRGRARTAWVPPLPVALPGALVERLQGIDARLVETDAALMALSEAGATGLAEPGVASRVSERAALAQERLAAIAGLVTEIGAWTDEARERLAAQDRRISRALNAGAVVASLVALFFAGLNVLLFQQGRRWSRRGR